MLKRLLDFSVSIIGLICLFPVFIVIIIMIKLDSQGSIFFRQKRVGRFGKIFHIHKFRTMVENTEYKSGLTIGKDSRITRVGFFLRKYKLDELPQLIDVCMGNMSIVGPRPELQEFMDLYPDDIRQKILSVRPGITDYASLEMIDESNILSKYTNPHQAYVDIIMPIKAKYYLRYVENNSIVTDLIIIFKTIFKIIRKK